MTYFLFILGFILLVKGADWLVDGSSSLAKKLKMSDLMIGLTVVAFGTSMPEMSVNILASIRNNNDIAIGNVVGSNIANILLILGISSVIYPLTIKKSTAVKEIPFALLSVAALWLLVMDNYVEKNTPNILTRPDGLVLILFFIIFLYYTFSLKAGPADEKFKTKKLSSSLALILAGLVFLVVGGNWIVEGAIKIAVALGISQALIGLTIVAVGTSLPELATSAMAAWRHKPDIAIGNVVGSNIFNILWILGLSSVISPIKFSHALSFDVYFMAIITLVLFAFAFVGKKYVLQRWQGFTMIIIYMTYITYLVIRG